MLLVKDGRGVTVLERDAAAGERGGRAVGDWGQPGLNPFRLPHAMITHRHPVDDWSSPRSSTSCSGWVGGAAARFDVLSVP